VLALACLLYAMDLGELLVNFDRGSRVGDADCRRWVR
jgi:hypothetical protein